MIRERGYHFLSSSGAGRHSDSAVSWLRADILIPMRLESE